MTPRAYSFREKILAVLMVSVVSVFLFQRFVYTPYRTRLNELETQKARKERQIRRVHTLLASRKEIEAEYAKRFTSRVSPRSVPGEMGAFLKTIEKLAREKNVKVLDIRPNPANDQPARLSAHFVTESPWPRLATLLAALEDQRVTIDKITLTRSPQSPQTIKAQLHLTQE